MILYLLQSIPNVPQRIASRLTSRPKPRSAIQQSSEIQSTDEANNTLQRAGTFPLYKKRISYIPCAASPSET